jgi:hypothetical protein
VTRAVVTLINAQTRARVSNWARTAPRGTIVEFKESKRSSLQNAMMWAMLTEISLQKTHCDRHYTPDQWKVLFMHACGRQVQFLPSLDGSTFVPWGQHSSQLTKDEMAELIECILAWGTENGVKFQNEDEIIDAAS